MHWSISVFVQLFCWFEFSFLFRLVSEQGLKNPVCPSIYPLLKDNWWIHAFPWESQASASPSNQSSRHLRQVKSMHLRQANCLHLRLANRPGTSVKLSVCISVKPSVCTSVNPIVQAPPSSQAYASPSSQVSAPSSSQASRHLRQAKPPHYACRFFRIQKDPDFLTLLCLNT